MTSSFGDTYHPGGSSWKLEVSITIVLIAMTASVFGAATFVSGLVPDWNQPYRYGPPPGGPTDPLPVPPNPPGAATQWNAWCAPSAAANLVGHWTDARGVPVADAFAFPSTTNWPLAASWHDYQADGFARPVPQDAAGALPVPTTDIGWYMDTNRSNQWDNGLGWMGGYYFGNAGHTGTYLKDIQPGLQNFLNSRYSLSGSIYWLTGTRGFNYFSGVNPAGVPNVAPYPNESNAFAEVKSEIGSNRTLILCFKYWNPTQIISGTPRTGTNTESAFGYTNYFMATPSSPFTNAEDEAWNFNDDGSALGHAVTCVGYIPAGDLGDPYRLTANPTDWVIVHDNWVSTPRNVAVAFGTPSPAPGGTFNANWVANTTAVPWPTAAKFVKGFVPDWNQPYRYNVQSPNGGPGPDPVAGQLNQWNDWCVPTSAANLAGHWEDHHGAPVADGTPFAGSTVAWAAGPSWQDYLADGTAGRPIPQLAPGPLPPSPTDIGWYMDTNRGMLGGGGGGGYFFGDGAHAGTFVKNIHVGLANYLNSLYSCLDTNNASGWWDTGTEGIAFAGGLNPTGGVAQIQPNESHAFAEVEYEINRDHTLIISFLHWNVLAAGAADLATDSTNSEAQFGGSYYTNSTPTGSSNAEDEDWNEYNGDYGLGHAVTAVGYIPANDVLDPGMSLGLGPTDWVIVHDNWASTPRNVIVPYGSPLPPPGGAFNAAWAANTIAYPDPGFLRVTKVELAGGTNAMISFTGIPGALHHLYWQSDATNTTWSRSVSNMAFCAGTMQMTNTVSSSESNRFYRIKASY